MKKIIKLEYQISMTHPNKATTYTSLICVILLSIHVQAQTQYVFQSEAPIANFTWDENDTSRYEGHYRFVQNTLIDIGLKQFLKQCEQQYKGIE